jgi:hypothetical protein
MKNEVLVFDGARSLAESILDFLRDEGYNADESVPALMLAAAALVIETMHPSQAVDEAVNAFVEEYDAITDEQVVDQDIALN